MPPERLNELWEKFLANRIDEAGARELLAYFKKYPDELEKRRKDAQISAGLSCLYGNDAEQQRLIQAVRSCLIPQEERAVEKRVMSSLRRRRKKATASSLVWMLGATAAALVAAALLYTAFLAGPAKKDAAVTEAKQPEASVELLVGEGSVGMRELEPGKRVRLLQGEQLDTGEDSTAKITLEDGSLIEVKKSSRVKTVSLGTAPVIALERGVVVVEAQPRKPDQPLVVQTDFARVKVVGTKFRVTAEAKASHVAVEHGKVSVLPVRSKGLAQDLETGGAISATEEGVRMLYPLKKRHWLSSLDGKPEDYTDPVVLSSSDTVMPWPVLKLSYVTPKVKPLGWGGVFWKTKLNPDETQFELWLRPLKMGINPEFRLMKMVLLASTGPTEYRIGDVHLSEKDTGEWVVLRGKLGGASVNWQAPNEKGIELKPENVRQISLRTEIGTIDAEFGPVFILSEK